VALTQSTASGVELHDVIVFLHPAPFNKHVISILVDTPARVTAGGIGVGRD